MDIKGGQAREKVRITHRNIPRDTEGDTAIDTLGDMYILIFRETDRETDGIQL